MSTKEQDTEKGLKIREAMWGAAGVERAKNATPFVAPIEDMVTRYCFGEVWAREGLDRRTRSMLTISMLIALGKPNQLANHVRGAIANGVTKDEILEVLLQAMIYCGVPASVAGMQTVVETLKDMGLE
jgi:4-carboxymuconolactone decarboxylase